MFSKLVPNKFFRRYSFGINLINYDAKFAPNIMHGCLVGTLVGFTFTIISNYFRFSYINVGVDRKFKI